jgi:hypothetical protein
MAADGFKENQTVGAAPVDDECALSSPQIVGDRTFHTVILIRMSQNGLVRLIVAQHLCHICTHEPGLTLLVNHCPDFSELLISEFLNFLLHNEMIKKELLNIGFRTRTLARCFSFSGAKVRQRAKKKLVRI